MGNHVLTFEELTTIFCQFESILNSRPIGVLSKDPNDGEILTPAHLTLECTGKPYLLKAQLCSFNISVSMTIPLTVQNWQITS